MVKSSACPSELGAVLWDVVKPGRRRVLSPGGVNATSSRLVPASEARIVFNGCCEMDPYPESARTL